MKLGAGTYAWSAAGESLERALREIAGLGIEHVDILGIGHGHPERLPKTRQEEIGVLMEDLGLRASSILALYEGNIASPDEKGTAGIAAYMKDILLFCNRVNCRQILYKPGNRIIGVPHERAWANSVAFTRAMSPIAADHGVLITFEMVPVPYSLVQTTDEMDRMIREVGCDNVYANIDLGHVALVRDSADHLAVIADRTVHLHLNDNDTCVHTNDVVGTGSVPIGYYLDALLANGAETACRTLGIELVAGIEIEVDPSADSRLTPLAITRMSRDYVAEHLPQISL